MNYDPTSIGAPFQIEGDFVSAEPYGSGHIHDTFVESYRRAGSTVRYVHQRINRRVFSRPIVLMDNICRITSHIREKLINEGAGAGRASSATGGPHSRGKTLARGPEGRLLADLSFHRRRSNTRHRAIR